MTYAMRMPPRGDTGLLLVGLLERQRAGRPAPAAQKFPLAIGFSLQAIRARVDRLAISVGAAGCGESHLGLHISDLWNDDPEQGWPEEAVERTRFDLPRVSGVIGFEVMSEISRQAKDEGDGFC
jgi:hypothetical protein